MRRGRHYAGQNPSKQTTAECEPKIFGATPDESQDWAAWLRAAARRASQYGAFFQPSRRECRRTLQFLANQRLEGCSERTESSLVGLHVHGLLTCQPYRRRKSGEILLNLIKAPRNQRVFGAFDRSKKWRKQLPRNKQSLRSPRTMLLSSVACVAAQQRSAASSLQKACLGGTLTVHPAASETVIDLLCSGKWLKVGSSSLMLRRRHRDQPLLKRLQDCKRLLFNLTSTISWGSWQW